MNNTAPCPDTSAVKFVDSVDEDTEGSEPSERDNDINCQNMSAIDFNFATAQHGGDIQGHEKKPNEKGINHIRPSRMDRPATTSV